MEFNTFGFSNGGGNGIDWGSVINQGFGLSSQIIGAWGRNPTQQIGNSSVVGLGQGYSPAAVLAAQAQAQQQMQQRQLQQQQAYQASLGGGVGSGIDGAIRWMSANPMIVLGAGVGLFLLMKQPPGRR